jgi:hypothetical protein
MWGDSISAQKADNGFILRMEETLEDGSETVTELVFEDIGDGQCIVDFLQAIANHFGFDYSKHQEENLEIGWGREEVPDIDWSHLTK